MSTFTKQCFSGSTNGKGVKVVATATAGTLVHTAVAGTSAWDEIWLYATNNSAAACLLTVEFGAADTEHNLQFTVQPKDGLKCIVPGFVLQNGATVKAFAAVANVITMHGFVNNIA